MKTNKTTNPLCDFWVNPKVSEIEHLKTLDFLGDRTAIKFWRFDLESYEPNWSKILKYPLN